MNILIKLMFAAFRIILRHTLILKVLVFFKTIHQVREILSIESMYFLQSLPFLIVLLYTSFI